MRAIAFESHIYSLSVQGLNMVTAELKLCDVQKFHIAKNPVTASATHNAHPANRVYCTSTLPRAYPFFPHARTASTFPHPNPRNLSKLTPPSIPVMKISPSYASAPLRY